MVLYLNTLFESSCNLLTIYFTLCLRGLSFRRYVVSIYVKYLNLIYNIMSVLLACGNSVYYNLTQSIVVCL